MWGYVWVVWPVVLVIGIFLTVHFFREANKPTQNWIDGVSKYISLVLGTLFLFGSGYVAYILFPAFYYTFIRP